MKAGISPAVKLQSTQDFRAPSSSLGSRDFTRPELMKPFQNQLDKLKTQAVKDQGCFFFFCSWKDVIYEVFTWQAMFHVSDVWAHTHIRVHTYENTWYARCICAYTHRWTHTHTQTHTCTHTPHFKIQLSRGCGISALHAKWLWVSARHPQCATADNKIMAMSGAFVVSARW